MMFGALYIGRFQPFHNGHLKALEWILEREEKIILCIGSSQKSHEPKNPFTVGERAAMIWRVLKSRNLLDRVFISYAPDTEQHTLWVSIVMQHCPPFKKVYSNDPLTVRLFKEQGFEVLPIPLFNREKWEATKIRRLIAEGKVWEYYVPKEVAEFIKENKLDIRIRELFLV